MISGAVRIRASQPPAAAPKLRTKISSARAATSGGIVRDLLIGAGCVKTVIAPMISGNRELIAGVRLARRIAAFTGPVGSALSRADMAILTQAAPALVLEVDASYDGFGEELSKAS